MKDFIETGRTFHFSLYHTHKWHLLPPIKRKPAFTECYTARHLKLYCVAYNVPIPLGETAHSQLKGSQPTLITEQIQERKVALLVCRMK